MQGGMFKRVIAAGFENKGKVEDHGFDYKLYLVLGAVALR